MFTNGDVLRVHARRFHLEFPTSRPPDGVRRPFVPVSNGVCAKLALFYVIFCLCALNSPLMLPQPRPPDSGVSDCDYLSRFFIGFAPTRPPDIRVCNWGYGGIDSCFTFDQVLSSYGFHLRLFSYVRNVVILMFLLCARGGACLDGGGGEKDGGGGEWHDNDDGG